MIEPEKVSETGGRCHLCEASMGEEAPVVCASCQTLYHLDCWEFRHRCQRFGCSSIANLPLSDLSGAEKTQILERAETRPVGSVWLGFLLVRLATTAFTVGTGLLGAVLALMILPLLHRVRIPVEVYLLAGIFFGLTAPWVAGWLHDRPGRSAVLATVVGVLWIPATFAMSAFTRPLLRELGFGYALQRELQEVVYFLWALLSVLLVMVFVMGVIERFAARWDPRERRVAGSRPLLGFLACWLGTYVVALLPVGLLFLLGGMRFSVSRELYTLLFLLLQMNLVAYLPLRLAVERHGRLSQG